MVILRRVGVYVLAVVARLVRPLVPLCILVVVEGKGHFQDTRMLAIIHLDGVIYRDVAVSVFRFPLFHQVLNVHMVWG